MPTPIEYAYYSFEEVDVPFVLSPPQFTPAADQGEFTYTTTCDGAGTGVASNGAGTINPGSGTCAYAIQFVPTAAGPLNVTMNIPATQTAPNSNFFTITGNALAPYTGRVVWVPDYEAQKLQVLDGTAANATPYSLTLPDTCYRAASPPTRRMPSSCAAQRRAAPRPMRCWCTMPT